MTDVVQVYLVDPPMLDMGAQKHMFAPLEKKQVLRSMFVSTMLRFTSMTRFTGLS